MQEIRVEARSRAAPERIWSLLADTASWADWAPFDDAALERPGESEPEGVGALRRFRRGRRTTGERVVVFEPPRRFAYELVSGVPVSDYRAEVTLEPTDAGGTRITWESRFRGRFPVPAALVKPALARFIGETAEGLASAGEYRWPPDDPVRL
jgi:uncharacterized protein YndB with AHSA1/START domain